MLEKILWKLLMWRWACKARKYWSYKWLYRDDVQFNTGGFQKAIKDTTGHMPGEITERWIEQSGYSRKEGHAHWFNNAEYRDKFFG